MPVAVVLDPSEVAASRTQLVISNWVASDVEWGDAAIEAYMAEQARGQTPVDFRVPNRIVTIPLRLRTLGSTSFDTIRSQIQAKAALMQREGGWLKRTSTLGDVFADVVSATLKLGSSGPMETAHATDADAVLTLECLPDWYGAELDLLTTTETTAAELRKVMTGVKGNYPARTRIIVNETQGQTQRGLIWGIRSENYSAASTAALAYEAEALTPMDVATTAALTGASGGSVIRHSAGMPQGAWSPVLSTTILSGSLDMTHRGTYRVWVRVYSNTTIPAGDTAAESMPRVRLVWDVGDLTLPVENAPVGVPGSDAFYPLDLGEVRLDPPPVGTHRWRGVIQAYGQKDVPLLNNLSIDKLWLVPVDDGYGTLRRAPVGTEGLATFVARDGFDQTAGALTGKTAAVGGVWAGGGDTDDFTVETTGKTAQRATATDTSARRALLTGNHIAISVQVDFKISAVPTAGIVTAEVRARYVDTSNFLSAQFEVLAGGSIELRLHAYVAGTGRGPILAGVPFTPGAWYTLRLQTDASGMSYAWAFPQGTPAGAPALSYYDAALATGGTLATGQIGFADNYSSSSAFTITRNYDNFLAGPPLVDAVTFASQSLEMRHDGMFREDSTGTAYGPVSRVIGDLPRLPPSGLEGRSVELFVKWSRGDFDQIADSGIDDGGVQALYRPCWLFVPEP